MSAVVGNTLAERPQLKIDFQDRPIVAWIESDGAEKNVYVRRWDGTQWQALGTRLSALNGGNVVALSMALDPAGNPVVAWGEKLGTQLGVYVSRLNGTNWVSVGTNAFFMDQHDIDTLSVDVDSSGNPLVAFQYRHATQGPGVKIKEWTGTNWFEYPDARTPLLNEQFDCRWWTESDVVARSSGPLAAFTCDFTSGDQGLWVVEYVNGKWGVVGSYVSSAGDAYASVSGWQSDLNLLVTSAGEFLVAWSHFETPSESVRVARWSGASWQALGTNANWNSGNAGDTSAALAQTGRAMVAWSGAFANGTEIGVSTWTGSSWASGIPLSSDSVASTNAIRPSAAVDSSGSIHVAFQEGTTTTGDVYVYRANH